MTTLSGFEIYSELKLNLDGEKFTYALLRLDTLSCVYGYLRMDKSYLFKVLLHKILIFINNQKSQDKGAFTHPVYSCVFRIALRFLVITLVGSNQGKCQKKRSCRCMRKREVATQLYNACFSFSFPSCFQLNYFIYKQCCLFTGI